MTSSKISTFSFHPTKTFRHLTSIRTRARATAATTSSADRCYHYHKARNQSFSSQLFFKSFHSGSCLHSSFNHSNSSKAQTKNFKLNWKPIPVWIGASLLVFLTYLKKKERDSNSNENKSNQLDNSSTGVKIEGPWQVHVLGSLPLKSISRLYGSLNSYTLPLWFRVPGYKLYSWIFGVNLEEAEIQDLNQYKSLNDFFMRKLKKDLRPIDPNSILVSPSDGKIINFGTIEGRRVGSVKGLSYSVDALLLGHSQPNLIKSNDLHTRSTGESSVSDSHFANINDISYSVDDLMGSPNPDSEKTVESLTTNQNSLASSAKVQTDVVRGELENLPNSGNRMYFFVVYLAPGDYHRFHSPADWKVERRRHFPGELFSVSPWMAGKLADLFVLNERVALLGKWRHGFFSMTPVGATNVGSIMINFDSELKTNRANRQEFHEEVVYKSNLINGQALRKGDEVGAFSLGSTIVLVFEAPEQFQFSIKQGESIKVGQAIGNV